MFRYIFLVLFCLYIIFLFILSSSNVLPKSLWWLANAISMGPLYCLAFPLFITLPSIFVLPWKRSLFVGNLLSIGLLIYICGFVFHFGTSNDNFKSLLELRILTSNMGHGAEVSKLLKLIHEQAIDVTALEEIGPKLVPYFKRVSSLNVECTGSLCLISRFPIKLIDEKSRAFLKDYGTFIAQFEVALPTRIIDLVVVHLETPREGLEEMIDSPIKGIPYMKKVTEHQNIESWIASNWAAKGKNVIVAGDFNMTQISPMYKANWDWLDNAFQEVGNGFGYSKHTRIYGARIDHILFNKRQWIPVKSWVGDSLGGDHSPVIAVIKPK